MMTIYDAASGTWSDPQPLPARREAAQGDEAAF
jgi:hypothetical protein